MKQPVITIGIGEIGSVVARGLLRCGRPVFPVTRMQPLAQAAQVFPRERLIVGMLEGFDGDPEHKCMGHTAPARLPRVLALAQQFSLAVPILWDVAARNFESHSSRAAPHSIVPQPRCAAHSAGIAKLCR